MKMIEGFELSHVRSAPVYRWSEIREDAEKMMKMVSHKFRGEYELAYALSHCQVSHASFAFFVVHPDLAGAGKPFSHGQVVVNPKIIKKPEYVRIPGDFLDFNRSKVRNGLPLDEACMSFPYRKSKKVYRFHEIVVEYQTPWIFGLLRWHRRKLTGLASHVYQHEVDHSNGVNIFHGN